MKAIYIYNKHDAQEVALLERATRELKSYIEEVEVADFMDVREKYPISRTPALILVQEALQGDHLLTEDIESGKLRVTAELARGIQRDEQEIYQSENYRLDQLIKQEVVAGQDELLTDLVTREVI